MKITVPTMLNLLEDYDRKELLTALKSLGADEVFFAQCNASSEMQRYCDTLQKSIPFFRENGIEPCIWMTTLSFLPNKSYTPVITYEGEPSAAALNCPLDDAFLRDYCNFIRIAARTGVKKIVLDDDLRLHLPGTKLSCFCPAHMKLYADLLSEEVDAETMRRNLFDSAPNRYRKAWMDGVQLALEHAAGTIRTAVDEIDPAIEVLLCCGPSLFGGDGSDPIKLGHILRGRHPLSLRTIGAPYWQICHLGRNMLSALDFARHQAYELTKQGVTAIAEGDVYPRPRAYTSSALLEIFHTVCLADGNFGRMMKYGLDYTSSLQYEPGYIAADQRNKSLYSQIEAIFNGKKSWGLHLVEPFDRISHTHTVSRTPEMEVCVSPAREFANTMSIPLVFEPGTPNLIFGENARNLDVRLLQNGAVLDLPAALILMQEKQLDLGIISYSEAQFDENAEQATNCGNVSNREIYLDQNGEKVGLSDDPGVMKLYLKGSAELLSRFILKGCSFPAAFRYQNADGQRFLIYNFNAKKALATWGAVQGYCRQNQLFRAVEWMMNRRCPASCLGNPDLYTMVKQNETGIAVGLWNYFEDAIQQPVICLGESYRKLTCVNCEGVLEADPTADGGRRVVLNRPLSAYSFCFILAEK